MGGCVLIDPILFFISHAGTTGDFAGGPRPVFRAGQRPVAKGFCPIATAVRLPLIDDHFYSHGAAPDTTAALGLVGRRRQTPMSTLAIDRQWWRHAMPWRCCRPWFSACDQFQFAYPIKVCDFQPGIGNPIAQTRKAVTDAEFVLGMGSWANGNPKFTGGRADCSLYPQQVTQIGVTSLIEGTGQSDSRLHRCDNPRPWNLVVHGGIFEFARNDDRPTKLMRQWVSDITLGSAAAMHKN